MNLFTRVKAFYTRPSLPCSEVQSELAGALFAIIGSDSSPPTQRGGLGAMLGYKQFPSGA